MRVTNSMMVASTKININGNKSNVDHLNRQLANQKKIIKPSDDPVLAIRSLRLRSSLSTIDQYYERNIPDTESWMDVTETALVNIKDIITKSYEQVVYGATDELNNENRLAIQKELKALQEQVYTEGNAEYAGRTVFTGYKTNHKLTFTDSEEAAKADYAITEHLSYQNIEKKAYYINRNTDTTLKHLVPDPLPPNTSDIPLPKEYNLNRIRLSYDNMNEEDALVTFKYSIAVDDTTNVNVSAAFGTDADGEDKVVLGDYEFTLQDKLDDDGNVVVDTDGKTQKMIVSSPASDDASLATRLETGNVYAVYDRETNQKLGSISLDNDYKMNLTLEGLTKFKFQTGDTSAAEKSYESIADSDATPELFFNHERGELVMSSALSDALESKRTDIQVSYNKKGFDVGEVRPENFFDCVNNTDSENPVTYKNYDENGDWITEGIYYNIANKQAMQINTEARDVFDANIYRDMDELIDIVNMAIDSQNAVDSIKQKMESGLYSEDSDEYKRLNVWLDAANKQLDYAVQNMHDSFSASITTFQGYLEKVTLAVTDAGSRGERVALTKTRMNVQQTTFEELKSVNEDADLSDLMIDYSAAYVSYQAALQAAGKIGKMTLLDYI